MVTGVSGTPSGQGVTKSADNMTPPGSNGEVQKRPSEHRRSNKPIMEKRRRARINNCLNELKALILDAMKKDPARHSKLEKADILEMTVKHLEGLRTNSTSVDRFRAGFRECVSEVNRFAGLEPTLRHRLIQHLESSITPTATARPHLIPTPPSESEEQPPQSAIFISAGPGSGVRLVPTRLANGDIALVLPAQNAAALGAMPTLIPIPARTSSTGSASSATSSEAPRCYSPVSSAGWSSPTPDCDSAPLALVTRKESPPDEKPWRPW